MKQKEKGIKLGTKIIIMTLFVSFISSFLVSIVSIRYMRSYLLEEAQMHIMNTAKIAAEAVDGDQINKIQPNSIWTEDYNRVFRQLVNFLNDEEIVYIYTLREVDGEVEFIVDADLHNPASIGDPYKLNNAIAKAFNGQASLDAEITVDKWGEYYSAYAPIRDKRGDVAAVLAIDSSVDKISDRIQEMAKSLIMIEGICALIAFSLSLFAGNLMTKYVEEASRDSLTSMFNRRYALNHIDKLIEKNERFALLLMDIDYFKAINDTYGHQWGDRVLVSLANIIKQNVGPDDIYFRLGGDEFAVFFPGDVSKEQLATYCDRISKGFHSILKTLCPKITNSGLSMGCVYGKDKALFNDIYYKADTLLYSAKKAGKNRFNISKF